MRRCIALASLFVMTGCSLPNPLEAPPPPSVRAEHTAVPEAITAQIHAGLKQMHAKLDENKSGTLTAEELPPLMASMNMSSCWQDGQLLAWLDSNSDKTISEAEFDSPAMVDLAKAAVQSEGKIEGWNSYLHGRYWLRFWRGANPFLRGLDVRADFDRLDRNRDGYVTIWERMTTEDGELTLDLPPTDGMWTKGIPYHKMRPACD
jgi:hypothetical protein